MNISTWVLKHKVTAHSMGGAPVERDDQGWEHQHYKMQLRWYDPVADKRRKTPVFDWRQGMGIQDDPESRPDSLLDALISDASIYENARSFEDFCAEFGYDTDSRKAHATYMACGETAKWLKEFLGTHYEKVQRLDRL